VWDSIPTRHKVKTEAQNKLDSRGGSKMKLTKISASNYKSGDWKVMRLMSGSWIVWNVQTQTRTARDCPNTKWFLTHAECKKFIAEVK
jgi:hypothetical protein